MFPHVIKHERLSVQLIPKPFSVSALNFGESECVLLAQVYTVMADHEHFNQCLHLYMFSPMSVWVCLIKLNSEVWLGHSLHSKLLTCVHLIMMGQMGILSKVCGAQLVFVYHFTCVFGCG